MISDIYYRNRRGFPILSVVFIISCLLVTIPSYANPLWYEVFGGAKDYTYIWQLFTHNLGHGHPFPTGLPALAHLAMNILVIATCGVLSERIWGKTRFWLLTVGALALSAGGRLLNIYGNGASTIAWLHSRGSVFHVFVVQAKS